ncbi:MAG: polysaccharide pyruvyl transferase family protein [Candidatus Omnitrophica bacterium]|nr:polysaccharide pyruvyl transferase family protein [Candidatus Omnitrophota bacterium]
MTVESLKLSDSKFIRYFKSFVLLQGKHTGFYGNFGHGDLGDDASFYVGRKLLGAKVLPFSKRCYTFNPRVLKALLVGGGGIFRWECPYLPGKLLTKEQWDFPVIIYSAGINCDEGKEYSSESRDKISRLCRMAKFIGARDLVTQRFLQDMGFLNVSLIPDLELLLEPKTRAFHYQKEKFTVGIVISPHSEFTKDQVARLVKSFASIINLVHRNGKKVLILPFDDPLGDSKREANIIAQILKSVKNKNDVTVLRDIVQPEEMLFAIKKFCDVMICMRLHSAIFAANAGIPFLCVSFNKMHTAFMELMGLQDYEIRFSANDLLGQVVHGLDKVLADYNALQLHIKTKAKELREIIITNTEPVKKIINGDGVTA